ncbi:MAG: glycosyltransferase family 4 protein [Ruminococcaceae bacterium]|nr:glycosyltransferase family 4 protein [Oscillospiraceae bacterium]
MKILYVTTIGTTMGFFKNFIKKLVDLNYIVEIATNEIISPVSDFYKNTNCKINHIDSSRSPFSKSNFIAYKQLEKLLNTNGYNIVHCHTPVAAMLTRLAARKARKKGTRVIYTAHGFHFFKGAPLLNWLIYFPIEWLCSFFTDTIITINSEDYSFARKYFHAKEIKYVRGVGIDTKKFSKKEINKNEILMELNIPTTAKILFSVGELNKNKNHKTVIKALSEIEDNNIYYLIAGEGSLKDELADYTKELKIEDRVKFLGYRNDIPDLLCTTDIFCFPSYREGLPVSVMEAMASGLPIIASNIRGNVDLIDSGKGGFLCSPDNTDTFKESIKILLEDKALREEFGKYNQKKIEVFSLDSVTKEMTAIYEIKE